MQAAARIRADIQSADQALGTEGAEGRMLDAVRWLDAVSDRAEGQLDAPLAALERALVELGEAQRGVEACLEALNFNPAELEETEERLFAIRGLARKHGVAPDDLGDFAQGLRSRLAALDASDAEVAGLQDAVAKAGAAYDAAARALTARRRAAAESLDAAMAAELAPLKMERAVFATEDFPGRARPGRGRSRRLRRGHQPRRPGRAARQDRLGRRVEPLPAGAQGLPDPGQ